MTSIMFIRQNQNILSTYLQIYAFSGDNFLNKVINKKLELNFIIFRKINNIFRNKKTLNIFSLIETTKVLTVL